METATIKVKGMTCMGCVASVKRVLSGVAGVSAVDVSLEKAEAVVQYDAARAGRDQLKAAVDGAGFEAA
jgi:copper chaperone